MEYYKCRVPEQCVSHLALLEEKKKKDIKSFFFSLSSMSYFFTCHERFFHKLIGIGNQESQ